MPVLESPEVIVSRTNSGLTHFFQKPAEANELSNDTDVGLNTPLGTNVIIHSAAVHALPINGSEIILSLYLNQAWHGKDNFIQGLSEINQTDIEEKEPIGIGAPPSLLIRGAQNILATLEHLRVSFEPSSHEGAEIHRQVAHPALLGEIRDEVCARVEQSKSPRGENLFRQAYSGYGWQS